MQNIFCCLTPGPEKATTAPKQWPFREDLVRKPFSNKTVKHPSKSLEGIKWEGTAGIPRSQTGPMRLSDAA